MLAAMPLSRGQQVASSSGMRDVNLAQYREHLEELDGVVADCAAQLQQKTAPANGIACDPDRVGPDDRVAVPAGAGTKPREVRYDWLRSVLSSAGKKDSGVPSVVLGGHAKIKEKPVDAGILLKEAQERLAIDERQAEGQAAGNPAGANSAYAEQRKSLDAILARKEYQNITKVTKRERFLEWLDNAIDQILMRLGAIGARLPWIGRAVELLLVAGALTTLIWLLLRLERNARVRLVPDIETAPGAALAREWQLWLKDAETAAAAGAWREAIHSVYWASISRLESRRLWPADRARTPREYLALLGGSDPRKTTLTSLTRSFERTWYGGREAVAADFNAALHLAAELGVEAK
jgi:hypothetical protein